MKSGSHHILAYLMVCALFIMIMPLPAAAETLNLEANPLDHADVTYQDRIRQANEPSGGKQASALTLSENANSSPADQPGYLAMFRDNIDTSEIEEALEDVQFRVLGPLSARTFWIDAADIDTFADQADGLLSSLEPEGRLALTGYDLLTSEQVPEAYKSNINKESSYATNKSRSLSTTADVVDPITPSSMTIDDMLAPQQWAIGDMRLADAWTLSIGTDTIKIAVIDTGINTAHQDFVGTRFLYGWDFVNNNIVTGDVVGHGTMVSGIIAATTCNTMGIAGICWNCSIMPLQVFQENGLADEADVIDAIYFAADSGCKVINLSLGGPGGSSAEYAAIQYAWAKGCIIVAAAGNSGDSTLQYPASYNGVISVAAHDSADQHASFSSYNALVDVSAPGVNILSLDVDGGYTYGSGTSFAAPQVSGVAALAAAYSQTLTPAQFLSAIQTSSVDLGTPGRDNCYGYGKLNAFSLLSSMSGTQPDFPPMPDPATVLSPDIYSLTNMQFDADGYYVGLYTYTPSVTGRYNYAAQSAGDSDIYIYDHATQTAVNWDNRLSPFWMSVDLQAGRTYDILILNYGDEYYYYDYVVFALSSPATIDGGWVLLAPQMATHWSQSMVATTSTAGSKVVIVEPVSDGSEAAALYTINIRNSSGSQVINVENISGRQYFYFSCSAPGNNQIDIDMSNYYRDAPAFRLIYEDITTMVLDTVYRETLKPGDYLTAARYVSQEEGRYHLQASRTDATICLVDTEYINYPANSCDFDLRSGRNNLFFIFTDGTASDMTYSINRLSPVSTLSGLQISTGILSPSFSPGIDHYTVELGHSEGPVVITPTLTQPNSNIKFDGVSRSSLAVDPLPGTSQNVQILVTSEDGLHQSHYSLTIHRPFNQCDLLSMDEADASFWIRPAAPICGMTFSNDPANLSFHVSEGATWMLYSDPECTQIFNPVTPGLTSGLNELYLKIVAENGFDYKIWSLLFYRLPESGPLPFASVARDLLGRPVNDGGATRADVVFYTYGAAPFDGEASYNGQPLAFSLLDPLTLEGDYIVTVSDQNAQSKTIHFSIDKTGPMVSGVANSMIYYSPRTITFVEGTATLDGQAFVSGQMVSIAGNHTLIVIDAAGNETVICFTLAMRTIVFDSQNGSTVASGHAYEGDLLAEPIAPARTGYTFSGWYKDIELTVPWNFAADLIVGDMTLYAKWAINQYTVAFNSQGGSSVASKVTDYNTLITAPIAPTRTGYTFAGWYKESTCVNAWNFATDKVTVNTTLYAKWTINTYTVAFNSQGGSGVSSKVTNYNTAITAPTAPTRSGYLFVGWYKESGCVNVWTFATDKVAGNTTLYARWLQTPAAGLTAASAGYDRILLKWTATSGATGYDVFRATSSTGAYTKIGTSSTNTFTNIGLNTNTIYYYKVLAYAAIGATQINSGYSAVASAKPIPSAPTGIAAVSASYSSIRLTWNAVPGANGYAVYCATSLSGSYSLVSSSVSTTTYTHTGRSTGTTYYYKVKAYRLVGTTKIYSEYSIPASAKTILNVPTNLKAASASYSSIKLTWSAVSGASGYAIYRSTSLSGTYAYVTSTSYLTYTNTSRLTGTTYYYKIRAYRLVGTTRVYSDYTGVAWATPLLSTSSTFTVARYSATSIKLTWSAVSGRTGYEVWQATSLTGTYSLIKTTTYTYFTHTGLTTGKSYYYKVRAYRLVGTVKVYGAFTAVKAAVP
jgi:uncharacterized repeat protein (TIGR02543 family)